MRFLEQIGQAIADYRKVKVGHQNAMQALTGMKTQQYSRLENGADVRLSSLLRVTEALELEMALVPRERMLLVDIILEAPDYRFDKYKALMLQQLQQGDTSSETLSGTRIQALMRDLSDD